MILGNPIGQIREISAFVTVIDNEEVTSNHIYLTFEDIMAFNQEEADTRLILHGFNKCKEGLKKLLIIGSDVDIEVITLCLFHNHNVNELWDE